MVSRETRVQLVVVTIATVLLVAVASSVTDTGTYEPLFGFVVLVYYGVIFGGTHLYLAWRGEGGSVPVGSRWRFLAALATLLALGAFGAFGPDGQLAGIRTDVVLAWLGVAILLTYWLFEARDGYLANRPT